MGPDATVRSRCPFRRRCDARHADAVSLFEKSSGKDSPQPPRTARRQDADPQRWRRGKAGNVKDLMGRDSQTVPPQAVAYVNCAKAKQVGHRKTIPERLVNVATGCGRRPQRAPSNLGTGGGRGIRTPDTVSRIHAFQACAFSHSATPPAGSDAGGRSMKGRGSSASGGHLIVSPGDGGQDIRQPPPTADLTVWIDSFFRMIIL